MSKSWRFVGSLYYSSLLCSSVPVGCISVHRVEAEGAELFNLFLKAMLLSSERFRLLILALDLPLQALDLEDLRAVAEQDGKFVLIVIILLVHTDRIVRHFVRRPHDATLFLALLLTTLFSRITLLSFLIVFFTHLGKILLVDLVLFRRYMVLERKADTIFVAWFRFWEILVFVDLKYLLERFVNTISVWLLI